MFRVICLGRLTDPSKADIVVAAAWRLIEEEPHVRHGEAAIGLRIIEDLVPHAHYSWIFDFEDEQGWRAYMSGEPHHRFSEVVTPYLESAIITEYQVGNELNSRLARPAPEILDSMH